MTSIVLAGGGTAGHTSPLIATAHALQRIEPDVELVCIGTARGLEVRVIPAAGLDLELITPVPLPRRPGVDLVKMPWRLAKSVRESRRILKQVRADALVGFGGYVSIPAYLAARSLGVPVVVHEANLVPGIANKVGARFAKFVAITFPETPMQGEPVGMPIARSITHPTISAADARTSFKLAPDLPTLLVSGGSQGARSINLAVAEAVDQLLHAGVQILHVLGPKNMTPEHGDRQVDGVWYRAVAFVEEMSRAYAAADLMLARAGAATVMETAVMGLPVIFVPLPWGNGEQGRNAAGLVDVGAGVLLPDSELGGARLVSEVTSRILDPERLREMSRKARGHYPSDAADVLARASLAVAHQKEV